MFSGREIPHEKAVPLNLVKSPLGCEDTSVSMAPTSICGSAVHPWAPGHPTGEINRRENVRIYEKNIGQEKV